MKKAKVFEHSAVLTPKMYPYIRFGVPEGKDVYLGPGTVLYKEGDEWKFYAYPPDAITTPTITIPQVKEWINKARKAAEGAPVQKVTTGMYFHRTSADAPYTPATFQFITHTPRSIVGFIDSESSLQNLFATDPDSQAKAIQSLGKRVEWERIVFQQIDPFVFVHSEKGFRVSAIYRDNIMLRDIYVTGTHSDTSGGVGYTFVRKARKRKNSLTLSEDSVLGSVVSTPFNNFMLYYSRLDDLLRGGAVLYYNSGDERMITETKRFAGLKKEGYTENLQILPLELDVDPGLVYTIKRAGNGDMRDSYLSTLGSEYDAKTEVSYITGLSLPIGGVFGKKGERDALVIFNTHLPQFYHLLGLVAKTRKHIGQALGMTEFIQMGALELPSGVSVDDIDRVKIVLSPGLQSEKYFSRITTHRNTKTMFVFTKDGKVLISGHHGILVGDNDGDSETPLLDLYTGFVKPQSAIHRSDRGRLFEFGFAALKEIDIDDKIHDAEIVTSFTEYDPELAKIEDSPTAFNILHVFVLRGEKGTYIAFKGVSAPFDSKYIQNPTIKHERSQHMAYNGMIFDKKFESLDKYLPEGYFTHYIYIPDKDAVVLPNSTYHNDYMLIKASMYTKEYLAPRAMPSSVLHQSFESSVEAGIAVLLPSQGKVMFIRPPQQYALGAKNDREDTVYIDQLAKKYPFEAGSVKVSTVDMSLFTDFVPAINSHVGRTLSIVSPKVYSSVVCKVGGK